MLVQETVRLELVAGERRSRRGWLSRYARGKKLAFFFDGLSQDASILDVGCGSGWLKRWSHARGWTGVMGIDLCPPADVVGDVVKWKDLGLEPHSFDVIVAFEVLEHGDLAPALFDLLKPDGLLMATTPVPYLDWLCKALEAAGILQRRVGPHTHLVDLRRYPGFTVIERQVKGLISQWGILAPA